MALTYRIVRDARRRSLKATAENGELVVYAPRGVSEWQIRMFVSQNADRLEQILRKERARTAAAESAGLLSEADVEALKKAAKKEFPRLVERFAPLVGVSYGRIAVRVQKTRWGSCSGAGNLNFNALLMLAPENVREYVVVHELCHRKHMDHSTAFWAEVARVYPGYRAAKSWLTKNGGVLQARVGK